MANPEVSYFVDDSAVASRAAETPNADFAGGMNVGASNAPVIGVNADGGEVVGEPQQFTLLDQDEDARTPQVSQVLGGVGYTDPTDYPSSGGVEGKGVDALRIGAPSDTGDGTVTGTGNATLTDLATGWVAV